MRERGIEGEKEIAEGQILDTDVLVQSVEIKTDRWIEGKRDTDRERERGTHRERETETKRERHTHTHTDKERERQREREKVSIHVLCSSVHCLCGVVLVAGRQC